VSARWPEPADAILAELEARLRDLLGANLRGMYVYGSLAFGCYHPERSDVDVLVLTERALAPETHQPLFEALRQIGDPPTLEISFLAAPELEPWRHPCPCQLHVSGSAEVRHHLNHDLAAEITNARARGVALVGPPAEDALPRVPERDFLDSIRRDVEWARAHVEERPEYAVLNSCRVLAYDRERTVMSKAEAAEWGLRELPQRFKPVVERAAAHYAGAPAVELDRASVVELVDRVAAELDIH
jgi:streptomycin 3"-adenylyltransferase